VISILGAMKVAQIPFPSGSMFLDDPPNCIGCPPRCSPLSRSEEALIPPASCNGSGGESLGAFPPCKNILVRAAGGFNPLFSSSTEISSFLLYSVKKSTRTSLQHLFFWIKKKPPVPLFFFPFRRVASPPF